MNTVLISVGNSASKIVTPLPDNVMIELYMLCSFKIEGAEHSVLYKQHKWDGYKHLLKRVKGIFPTGLLNRVCGRLIGMGYLIEIDDQRRLATRSYDWQISDTMETRWYQLAAAQAAIEAKCSIIQLATGGGKTPIAVIITSQLGTTTLFLVHTKDLLRQAKSSYREFMGIDVGQIGDGIVDPQPVTVATIQTIARALGTHYKRDSYCEEDDGDDTDISGNRTARIRDFCSGVGLLIQDEAHRVASDSAFEVSSLIDAEHRVGLSASPWRDDGADLMIEAAYGHRVFQMSASELIDMRYLMQPTISIKKVLGPSYPMGKYEQIYKEWVVDSYEHNAIVLDDAASMWREGRSVLVLVKQIKHGDILSSMFKAAGIESEFLQGNDSSNRREGVIQRMRERNLRCLIATTIADEGLDIKPLDGLILAGRGKSSVRALQRIGRTLRIHDNIKLRPLIRDYWDQTRFLKNHTMERMRIYKTEPNFIIDVE